MAMKWRKRKERVFNFSLIEKEQVRNFKFEISSQYLENRTFWSILKNIVYFWQEMYSGFERPRVAWSPPKIRRPKGPGWTFATTFARLPCFCIRNVLRSILRSTDYAFTWIWLTTYNEYLSRREVNLLLFKNEKQRENII